MNQNTELTSVLTDGSRRHRLAFNRVNSNESTEQTLYSIGWRGNSRSPNGFVKDIQHFDLHSLGQLIRQAMESKEIPNNEKRDFVRGLLQIDLS